MKRQYSARVVIFFAVLFIGIAAMVSHADTDSPVTVPEILTKAGCPFNEEQAAQFLGLDFGNGREAFTTLFGMFNDTQNNVLKKALGVAKGMNGSKERPRYLLQAVLFEKSRCPLSHEQIVRLLALPAGSASNVRARKIYTDEQNEALNKIFQSRRR